VRLNRGVSPQNLRKYAVPEALEQMMSEFAKWSPDYWTEEEYDELLEL
jgi:hypothetical protein